MYLRSATILSFAFTLSLCLAQDADSTALRKQRDRLNEAFELARSSDITESILGLVRLPLLQHDSALANIRLVLFGRPKLGTRVPDDRSYQSDLWQVRYELVLALVRREDQSFDKEVMKFLYPDNSDPSALAPRKQIEVAREQIEPPHGRVVLHDLTFSADGKQCVTRVMLPDGFGVVITWRPRSLGDGAVWLPADSHILMGDRDDDADQGAEVDNDTKSPESPSMVR